MKNEGLMDRLESLNSDIPEGTTCLGLVVSTIVSSSLPLVSGSIGVSTSSSDGVGGLPCTGATGRSPLVMSHPSRSSDGVSTSS